MMRKMREEFQQKIIRYKINTTFNKIIKTRVFSTTKTNKKWKTISIKYFQISIMTKTKQNYGIIKKITRI